MNLFRKALANWRRPAYPLDYQLVRNALVDGEKLHEDATGTSELPSQRIRVVNWLADKLLWRGERYAKQACACLLYAIYKGPVAGTGKYEIVDFMRRTLPQTDNSRDIDELRYLYVRVSQTRKRLVQNGWNRRDLQTRHNEPISLSPILRNAIKELVEEYEKSRVLRKDDHWRDRFTEVVRPILESDASPHDKTLDLVLALGEGGFLK